MKNIFPQSQPQNIIFYKKVQSYNIPKNIIILRLTLRNVLLTGNIYTFPILLMLIQPPTQDKSAEKPVTVFTLVANDVMIKRACSFVSAARSFRDTHFL